MAFIQAGVAVSMILASATATDPNMPIGRNPSAKAASSDQAVKYCVETEPFTGSKITKTQCRTRAEWAREGVDVDQLRKTKTP